MSSANDTKSESRNMTILLVMGVCGSGKTTVGEALSKTLGWTFVDGDDFHSKENKIKMSCGQPLTDQDRIPWLLSIHEYMSRSSANNKSVIVACSALKRSYRDVLCCGEMAEDLFSTKQISTNRKLDIKFIHLTGSKDILETRLCNRLGHYMPANLLQSQLDTLEVLDDDEVGICVDIVNSTEEKVQNILTELAISV